MTYPIALTIAGSDSGGGAGVQADLKTFHAFSVFGTCGITAVTAQNTLGVSAVHEVPAAIVRSQIDAVATDLTPAATKTGMLATVATIEAVVDGIRAHGLTNIVVDPVFVATSGQRLLDADAQEALLRLLVPLATLLTPNIAETTALVGHPVTDEAQMRDAAQHLLEAGAGAVLVKGGHLPGGMAIDIFCDGEVELVWKRPRIDTSSTHGTGCTLSAAVTAGLALGQPLRDAVHNAVEFTAHAIRQAPGLGSGNGPLNHFLTPEPNLKRVPESDQE